MTASKNKVDHIYFDVSITYHPTGRDKVGKDGVYIKSVDKIDIKNVLNALMEREKKCSRKSSPK